LIRARLVVPGEHGRRLYTLAVHHGSNRHERAAVVVGGTLRVGDELARARLRGLEHGEDRRQATHAAAVFLFADLFEPGGRIAASAGMQRLLIAALERLAIGGVERLLVAEARPDVGGIGAGAEQRLSG